MNEVGAIGGPAATTTLREFVNDAAPRSAPGASPDGHDRIEISEWARFLSRLAELPDVRVEKVAQARKSIGRGDYETPDRLDHAINRLIEVL